MINPNDSANIVLSSPELKDQAKKKLQEFFQQKSVKNLVSVLVPGVLAAVLFPVFGPVVAGGAAAVAVHNILKLVGISFSTESVEKMLKPLEGGQIDENDVQTVLEELLQKDKQVNEEAAKALVTITPEVKEAALTNPKLDPEWLGKSFETSLKEQGGMMEKIAPQLHNLIISDEAQLLLARDRLLAHWSLISQEVLATHSSEISNVEQNIEGGGGQISQSVAADDHSTIGGVKQNTKQT